MGTLIQRLARVVGEDNLVMDTDEVSEFFARPVDEEGPIVARPASCEHVQKIVVVAADKKVPVFTTYDTWFPPRAANAGPCVCLDFSRMSAIERIDPKNLVAHVQRGVTFEQLLPELARHHTALSLPVAATSRSVVEQYVARAPCMRAARYPEIAACNMKVVLPDGRVHLTGSHALSEHTADHKADPGANLSQWYWGADDIHGIVVRASIWLFPVWDQGRVLLFGFHKPEGALALAKELPRRELCTMALVLDKDGFASRTGIDAEAVAAPWVLAVAAEGFDELAAYRARTVRQVAVDVASTDLSDLLADTDDPFARPWYATKDPSVGFYTVFSRVPEFEQKAHDLAGAHITGRMVLSVANGGAAYVHYTTDDADRAEDLALDLAKAGAFFDRPHGRLAEAVYSRMPEQYCRQMERVRGMLDQGQIINPV